VLYPVKYNNMYFPETSESLQFCH